MDYYSRILQILDESLPHARAAEAEERAAQEQRRQAEAAQRKQEAVRAAYNHYTETAATWGLPTDDRSARAYAEAHYITYMQEDNNNE